MKSILAAAAIGAVTFSANASVDGGVAANQSPSSFIALSQPGNVLGGSVYSSGSSGIAAIPMNTAPPKNTVGNWLAASKDNGGDAVVSFGLGTSFVSFLWGSPDTYNTLTVNSTMGSYTFTSASPSLSGIVFNGNQDFAYYAGFSTNVAGELITSLRFSSTSNAFEASNFSVTTPVPEPETYALLLAGLGVVGFMARRRKAA